MNTLSILPTPQELATIDAMVEKYAKSGALPSSIQNAAQLHMVMMAGFEAGMRPMESLNAFYIVNGKLTMYGDAVIRQLKKSSYKIAWKESTDKVSTVVLTDKDGNEHEETYTWEEAVKAGLTTKKGPWQTDPKSMMRWKCIGRAIRFFCPEVLGGTQYLKEEAQDFQEITAVVDYTPAILEEIEKTETIEALREIAKMNAKNAVVVTAAKNKAMKLKAEALKPLSRITDGKLPPNTRPPEENPVEQPIE